MCVCEKSGSYLLIENLLFRVETMLMVRAGSTLGAELCEVVQACADESTPHRF